MVLSGEDAIERGEPFHPELLVERQPAVSFGEARRIQLAVVVAASHVAADEPGPFEDADMLRCRLEGHVVRLRELADRTLTGREPSQHVAPRAVCERAKDAVEDARIGRRRRL